MSLAWIQAKEFFTGHFGMKTFAVTEVLTIFKKVVMSQGQLKIMFIDDLEVNDLEVNDYIKSLKRLYLY